MASEVTEISKNLDKGSESASLSLSPASMAPEAHSLYETRPVPPSLPQSNGQDMAQEVGSSENLHNRWCTALSDQNCVEVMKLLDACPKLAWQGWKEKPEMKGKRTALLVGVRRGYPDLVNKVLTIFGEKISIQPVELANQNLSLVVDGVGELLAIKDPHYELDAMDMAVFHGNGEIVSILANASFNCETNPYKIRTSMDWQKDTSLDEERMKIREITESVKEHYERDSISSDYISSDSIPSNVERLMEEYNKDCNFNFLPWKEYLFSFCCKFPREDIFTFYFPTRIRNSIFNEVAKSGSSLNLQNFLLGFKDGLGRTAVHVAVEAGTYQYWEEGVRLGVKDGLGRTAWHWAAAMGMGGTHIFATLRWSETGEIQSSPHDTFDMAAPHLNLERDWMISRYGCVDKVRPARLAIMHGHEDYLRDIHLNNEMRKRRRRQPNKIPGLSLFEKVDDRSGIPESLLFREHTITYQRLWGPETMTYYLGPLQLATIAGNASMVRFLLEDGQAPDTFIRQVGLLEILGSSNFRILCEGLFLEIICTIRGDDSRFSRRIASYLFYIILYPLLTILRILSRFLGKLSPNISLERPIILHSAFHIAAGCGNFELIKTFLEHGHKSCDIFVEDHEGNTALHHVMLGIEPNYYGHKDFKIGTKLLENVTLEQVLATQKRERMKLEMFKQKEDTDKAKLASIERQGCVELLLQAGLDPWITNRFKQAAHPGPSASPEFLSWWFDKLTKETSMAQNTLNAAANAISVTAALVATASYVGPLQPPLSYQENSIHMDDPLVRYFIVFDTLSFFFAVAAIMMALIPSIPIPRQSARTELQRTRKIVKIAVWLLFPSIVFVLVAFAMASIAIIPQGRESWKHGGLTMSTVTVGGVLCLCVIILFSLRILVVIDKTPSIRKFYDTLGV